MADSFDAVDFKVKETDFFLGKMIEAGNNSFMFSCCLSAFLSAARTITLCLQQLKSIQGFNEWYEPHRQKLKSDPLAKFLLEKRNEHVHGGPSPVVSGRFYQGESAYSFGGQIDLEHDDIVSSCRQHFINLLDIVHDCYVVLGREIDPQQYYTRENFESMGMTIDEAECEIWGWIMTSYIEDGMDVDDRWHELRGRVGECQINHLFKGYLGKVSPQPIIPERIMDFDFTDEDKGWDYIPHGFNSVEDYLSQKK